MAVWIESRYNDGYMAHHAQDMIRVRIIHRPEDGYLLSYDKEVIKEELPLTDFIRRLRDAEGGQKESFEDEMKRIDYALRERKERQICEWLDHRYVRVIKEKRAVLAEHTHSMQVLDPNRIARMEGETVGNTERTTTQWDRDRVMKHMNEQGYNVQQPMTPDEAFRVSDDEVYYSMTL